MYPKTDLFIIYCSLMQKLLLILLCGIQINLLTFVQERETPLNNFVLITPLFLQNRSKCAL